LTAMLAIHAQELTKIYRSGLKALQGIDLHVESGEVFCLAGPNGAGKTTLVRILGTQLAATQGEVRILGFDLVTQMDEIRTRLAVVPQEARAYPDLLVWEHIYYYLVARGFQRSAARSATRSIIDDLGLDGKYDQPVARLSGGMRHRVLLGMALASGSELLLLDEPTASLDVLIRRQTWDLLKRLARRTTILLTTHSMEEAEALADRVGIVHNGRLIAVGTPRELRMKAPGRFKVVLDESSMAREQLAAWGHLHVYAGKWAVFFDDETSLRRFLDVTVERSIESSVLHATLEDVFVHLVGDASPLRLGELR
jgi:ABC-2 type transport system ATP-binding protein